MSLLKVNRGWASAAARTSVSIRLHENTKPRKHETFSLATIAALNRLAPFLVFLVALAVRLLHLWQIRRAPFFDVLLGDARGYDAWAQQIAAGDWIGRDVFYQAPLYPYFLG